MKKLLAFLLVVLMCLVLAKIANSYTYDSDIDPDSFNTWDVVSAESNGVNIRASITCDDPIINKAIVILTLDGFIMNYCYMKDGKPNCYMYDADEDAYREFKIPK